MWGITVVFNINSWLIRQGFIVAVLCVYVFRFLDLVCSFLPCETKEIRLKAVSGFSIKTWVLIEPSRCGNTWAGITIYYPDYQCLGFQTKVNGREPWTSYRGPLKLVLFCFINLPTGLLSWLHHWFYLLTSLDSFWGVGILPMPPKGKTATVRFELQLCCLDYGYGLRSHHWLANQRRAGRPAVIVDSQIYLD